MTVTKDTPLGLVLDRDPNTAKIFMAVGMHCLGCPGARSESIGEACMVHGTNPDVLIKKLNRYFASKE